MTELYKNIKNRRIKLEMTQSELAKKVGYSDKSMVAKVEKGKIDLPQSKIQEFAEALHTTAPQLMGMSGIVPENRIGYLPLYGSVCAGNGMLAEDNIEEWIKVGGDYDPEQYFLLTINGDSMEPEFRNGDTVIVRQQSTATDNDIVIAIVNGDEGVCKKLKKYADGMALVSINPNYEPRFFSEEQVTGIPVRIIGKVVAMQRMF